MIRYVDADAILSRMPEDLPYKASVKRVLIQAPAADVVEVRHGSWVRVESSDMATGIACICSECKKMRYGSWLPPYCQMCGAKMDGGAI